MANYKIKNENRNENRNENLKINIPLPAIFLPHRYKILYRPQRTSACKQWI